MGRIAQSRLTLSAELRKQRSTLTNKGTLFEGTGIHFPSPGVVQVDGQLQGAGFDGDLATDNVGTTGGALSATKAAMPELLLRPGSIGNDALINPVKPDSVWESAENFTVSPTWATVINKDVTVPAGFTSAVVSAKLRVTAFMNQDSPDDVDYLYAVLFINGNSSDYYPLAVTDIGGSGTNQVFRDVVLTGLTPGSTINLNAQASTGFETWTSPSAPGNKARLGASIQWFR
jgi:hypothetical protein